MANPNQLRNDTLAALLDRRDALQDALDVADGDQARALRGELRRVRELLTTYTNRSKPSRDMYV